MITQEGQNIPASIYTDQVNALQQLTLNPGYQPGYGEYVTAANVGNFKMPNAAAVFAGVIVLFFVLRYLTELPGADLKPAHIRVGVHNWIISGLFAMSFIVFAKVVVNKLKSTSAPVNAIRTFANAA